MNIDEKVCLGCGACISFYPELFEIVDGKARFKKEVRFNKHKYDRAKDHCPVCAIN